MQKAGLPLLAQLWQLNLLACNTLDFRPGRFSLQLLERVAVEFLTILAPNVAKTMQNGGCRV